MEQVRALIAGVETVQDILHLDRMTNSNPVTDDHQGCRQCGAAARSSEHACLSGDDGDMAVDHTRDRGSRLYVLCGKMASTWITGWVASLILLFAAENRGSRQVTSVHGQNRMPGLKSSGC